MASPMRGERLRVDIAQGLSQEGCGSGPRQTLARRRGLLSVCCDFSFSGHRIPNPEQTCSKSTEHTRNGRAGVWLTGAARSLF